MMTSVPTRRIYFAFEFDKDAHRRSTFLADAANHCHYCIEDVSLPAARHNSMWRREAKDRILSAALVLVLLGPDTHNAPGVLDELSLAGEVTRAVIQLQPKHKEHGLVSRRAPICPYRWTAINDMLRDPDAYHGGSSH